MVEQREGLFKAASHRFFLGSTTLEWGGLDVKIKEVKNRPSGEQVEKKVA